jgi:hypothetical protein
MIYRSVGMSRYTEKVLQSAIQYNGHVLTDDAPGVYRQHRIVIDGMVGYLSIMVNKLTQ